MTLREIRAYLQGVIDDERFAGILEKTAFEQAAGVLEKLEESEGVEDAIDYIEGK